MPGEDWTHGDARQLLQPLMDRLPSNPAGLPDVVRYDMTSDDESDFYGSLPITAWILWTVCLTIVLVAAPLFLYYLRTPPKAKKGPPLLDRDEESSEHLDITCTEEDKRFFNTVMKGLPAPKL